MTWRARSPLSCGARSCPVSAGAAPTAAAPVRRGGPSATRAKDAARRGALVLALLAAGCLPSLDGRQCFGDDGCNAGAFCTRGQCVPARDAPDGGGDGGTAADDAGTGAAGDATSLDAGPGAPDASGLDGGTPPTLDAGTEDASAPDAAPGADGRADSGAAFDAGRPEDAGAPRDASSSPDAAPPDASGPPDTGVPADAGAPTDSGIAGNALVITLAGTGAGSVRVEPGAHTCPPACSLTFPPTTIATLSATAAAGSSFRGWSDSCLGTGPCPLPMNAPRAVTATFAPLFRLRVMVSGAALTVQSIPAGIDACTSTGGTCSASFPQGTAVTLIAGGSPVVAWGGDCAGATLAVCALTMDGDRTASVAP